MYIRTKINFIFTLLSNQVRIFKNTVLIWAPNSSLGLSKPIFLLSKHNYEPINENLRFVPKKINGTPGIYPRHVRLKFFKSVERKNQSNTAIYNEKCVQSLSERAFKAKVELTGDNDVYFA